MEQLPLIPFFDQDNTNQFWQFVYAIMYVVAPILLIVLATDLGGHFLSVIREVFSFKRRKNDDSNEDYGDE